MLKIIKKDIILDRKIVFFEYETLSETEFTMSSFNNLFKPEALAKYRGS